MVFYLSLKPPIIIEVSNILVTTKFNILQPKQA